MGGKSSIQSGAFFYVYLLVVRAECPDSEIEFFYHQIIRNLPKNATEIVRFLKTFKIWGFFGKKTLQFFKIVKGGKFAVECVSNDTIS